MMRWLLRRLFGAKASASRLQWTFQNDLFWPDGSLRQEAMVYAKTDIGTFEIYWPSDPVRQWGLSCPRSTGEKFDIFATDAEAMARAQEVYDQHPRERNGNDIEE